MATAGSSWQRWCHDPGIGLLDDYSRQAQRYDETRAASPSALRALERALAGAPGPRLADVGGGTGNYAAALAARGWEPVVADRSAAMLERATAKGLVTVEADAQALPFPDESFDAVTLISMLHHVDRQAAAVAEAQRVVVAEGRVVVLGYTREDSDSLWVLDYFPSSREWMAATHPPRAEVLALLPGAQLIEFAYEDMEDASLAALSADPARVAIAAEAGATSFFERMTRDHPEELARGLDRLRADIAGGCAPRHPGTATVLSWTRPGGGVAAG